MMILDLREVIPAEVNVGDDKLGEVARKHFDMRMFDAAPEGVRVVLRDYQIINSRFVGHLFRDSTAKFDTVEQLLDHYNLEFSAVAKKLALKYLNYLYSAHEMA